MLEVLKVLAFLLWVNCLPSLASVFLGDRYPYPVDCGRMWSDNRPIVGKNKTVRGILASILGGIVAAPLLGLGWWIASVTAMLAMVGDLFSSFLKCRLTFHSKKNIIFLDQIFESLFPLLFLNIFLKFQTFELFFILMVFTVSAYFSSRLWIYIVDRPVPSDYPRIIKSRVRFREWRACHQPLARYQKWFNLTSILTDQIVLTWMFKISGLYARGVKNAADIRVTEKTFSFKQLPEGFEGFRILLLTDLHLDGVTDITEKIIDLVGEREVDLCLIGGDIRMKTYGDISECVKNLLWLVSHFAPDHGLLGVLGNHDCIEMLPDFEEAGVIMLVNDSWPIEKSGSRIWIIGVDDPHYYKLDDAREASKNTNLEEFSIYLAHSPESFKKAVEIGADLYLCGHTHGGQVCLFNCKPIVTNSRAPRFTAIGEWKYKTMKGYTSRGVGASAIPVRFNCPGEITLITLAKEA